MATLSELNAFFVTTAAVAVLDLTAEQAQAGQEPSWVGDERWRPIVLESVRLRQIAGEPQVRVLVGEHAVLVSGDDRHVVGVVFIKGHPVVKSVVRGPPAAPSACVGGASIRRCRASAPSAPPAAAPAAPAAFAGTGGAVQSRHRRRSHLQSLVVLNVKDD